MAAKVNKDPERSATERSAQEESVTEAKQIVEDIKQGFILLTPPGPPSQREAKKLRIAIDLAEYLYLPLRRTIEIVDELEEDFAQDFFSSI